MLKPQNTKKNPTICFKQANKANITRNRSLLEAALDAEIPAGREGVKEAQTTGDTQHHITCYVVEYKFMRGGGQSRVPPAEQARCITNWYSSKYTVPKMKV